MQSSNQGFSIRKHRQFQKAVWTHYRDYKRSDLPWRQTTDPYRIVVSELMLQQTQVARVVPKYQAFLKRFPTTKQLAAAPLADVLRYWQGLGYNRRAKYLHQSAGVVSSQYRGRWPKTRVELEELPGVGPYTAAAVAAFAYNQPEICLETNIRTALIHHYFRAETAVSEAVLRTLVAETLDADNPREWYWALMDYGAHIKKTHGNKSRQARSYNKQSRFTGSDREIRGAIIRMLTLLPTAHIKALQALGFPEKRLIAQCQNLCQEGLIEQTRQDHYRLAE